MPLIANNDLTAQASQLSAGKQAYLASGNDQTYQRARLAADGDMTLSAGGDITFAGAMDTHTESHEKSKSNWAWQSAKGKGTTDQTLRQSELVSQGQLAIQAANRVAIEVPEINAQSVRQTVDAMVAADPNLAWLKQAEAQGDIDWRTVKEIHDGWDYSQSGLGKGAAIAISIAAAAVVGPMAAGVAGGIGALGGAMAAGAAGSLAGTAAVSVINNRGNLGDTFDDTLSSDSLKGAALAATTAAASSWLDDAMNTSSNSVIDKTSLDGVLKFVGRRAAQAGTDAALEIAIQGCSFSDAVTHNLEGALATAFQAELFNFIGDKTTDAVDNSHGRFMLDGSAEKTLVHALAGGLAAEATGSDFRSGAIAAGANEALVTQLAVLVGNNPTLLVSASKITGILAAGMAGGDVEKGAEVAGNATMYNRMAHPEEKAWLEANASSEQERDRLATAACALTRCSRQFRTDSDQYKTSSLMELAGSSAAYASERQKLLDSGLFTYGVWDGVQDGAERYQVIDRAFGALQAVGSVALAGSATMLSGSGAGAILAPPLYIMAADQLSAGIMTTANGHPMPTFGAKGLSSLLGISEAQAEFYYGLAGMGGELGAARQLSSAASVKPSPIEFVDTGKALSINGNATSVAVNRALHESYKDGLRSLMEKPVVYDGELAKLIGPLYRPNAKIGNGSTAAAVRHEMATGEPVGNAFHSQKAEESIAALQRWLEKNPTARSSDRAAAENIVQDMSNALRGD